LKVIIGYPSKEEEKIIIRQNMNGYRPPISSIVTPQEVKEAQAIVEKIYIDEKIENYIVDIVFASREPQTYGLGDLNDIIAYGASPRASIALALAARGHALLQGRAYVLPQDVKDLAPDVLRHRIVLSYEAEAEGIDADDVIQKLLSQLRTP
jgi:MoxR-like ATPase